MKNPSLALCLLAWGAAQSLPLALAAPPAKKASAAEVAVDLIELKPAGMLRGAVLDRSPEGAVSIAVPREWMRTNAADLSAKHSAEEAAARKEQLVELLTRIDAWLNERPDEKRLRFFLDEERARIERLQTAKEDPALESPFVVIQFPAERIRRVVVQPLPRRQIALAAWQEGLADVESRSQADLAKELKSRGVDPAALAVDLSQRLAPRRDTEAQWAARRAIVEYELMKPINFQGTGDVLVRVGDDAKAPPLAGLASEMLSSQFSRELGDLLGTPAPKKARPAFEKATRAAERDGARGVRVSRVDQNLTARRVTVEETFLARMPDGSWQPVWSSTQTEDAAKARPDAEARIANDPQVKQALAVVRQLGLGEGDDAIQTAIRFGAAVMEAQKGADAGFYRFRDACLKRLDGPPFPWSEPAATK